MKNILRTSVILTIFMALIALSGCGSVKDCDQIGAEFYNDIKTGQYQAVVPLLDEEAVKETPASVWISGLMKKEEDMGTLLSRERTDFETITQNSVTRVGIRYKVIYAEGVMYEKLEFIQRGGDYKITYYMYNSDSTLVN